MSGKGVKRSRSTTSKAGNPKKPKRTIKMQQDVPSVATVEEKYKNMWHKGSVRKYLFLIFFE